jgi:N-methylhydantoinase A
VRLGVDTGGTFTDCVILEGTQVRILKVFSTPDDAARAILEGVRRLAGTPKAHAQPKEPLAIVHGTTLGTNSLLERRGARVALITTAGFEDLIEIGRQARPRLYDLNVQREPPLVPRTLRFAVKERTAADGKVLLRPSPAELRRLLKQVKRSGAESLALCFLFSFANPTNEQAVARALRELGVPISVSHEILPDFREYERLSTVVINAYLAPRMGTYLARLERQVGEGYALPTRAARDRMVEVASKRESTGLPYHPGGHVYVMQSSGGVTTARRAACEPVRTILSGPAGGVVATAWLAEQLKIPRAISFDMGGTSTDVCLIEGTPRTTHETTLGGLPVAVPVLDVHSVGAGGGSLARVDAGGALRVGPESAGALPGPVCYARGGTLPTVTDAHLLLGRLDPDHFLGGTFRLDIEAAERAFAEFLQLQPRKSRAGSSGFTTPLDLARGIVAVSNANMERALRVISVERGHDPRDFSLVCFGGAGGLHAADLARSLGLRQVIVPPNPGAFSALGILLSDVVKDVSQSVLLPVPETVGASRREVSALFGKLERQFARLERAGRAELRREHFPAYLARAERRLDVRYVGQAYELSVPFSAKFPQQFHREHEKAYGYAHAGRALEIVNLRLRLVIPTPKPPRRREPAKTVGNARVAMLKRKPVWFGERFWETPIYDRERLAPGARLTGPAVVVEYSSTTVVPPDFVCRMDESWNLELSRHAR